MASSFMVEVLTPEGQVFSDEVELLSTRTTTGSIGIKARHAPLMAILEPTELRLYKSDSDIVRFAQGEGYLQVVDNHALVAPGVCESWRARFVSCPVAYVAVPALIGFPVVVKRKAPRVRDWPRRASVRE